MTMIEKTINRAMKVFLSSVATIEDKRRAIDTVKQYGETAIIKVTDMHAGTDDLTIKIWLNCLLMAFEEEPIINSADIIRGNYNLTNAVANAITALIVINTSETRSALFAIYNEHPDKNVCQMILEALAKLGCDYIIEVHIRQILVNDPRNEVALKAIEIVEEHGLNEIACEILEESIPGVLTQRIAAEEAKAIITIRLKRLQILGHPRASSEVFELLENDKLAIGVQRLLAISVL